VTGTGSASLPDLFIIASKDEFTPPTNYVDFYASTRQTLESVDYDSSFVIFNVVGQIPNNGEIAKFVRRGSTVTIVLKSYSVGPGNYGIEGFTYPYQITVVTKNGGWGKEINFVLEVEGGDIMDQEKHFVP
jgi:hypothetical protein